MSDADRVKWDERYASGDVPARTHATELLEQWLPTLPRGRALDLACGAGRNAIRLAEAGYRVDALDISWQGLARGRARAEQRGLDIDWIEADLDRGPLPRDDYALIVVTRFLARNTVPWILDALGEGGFLIYEHHLLTTVAVNGPRRVNFLARPNELLRLFSPLRVLYYAERIHADGPERRVALAELVACRGDGGL